MTQKKRAERETEENKEKFRNLAETTSDWIWEVDQDGVYAYASPVVHELLGYRPEEVLGKRIIDFMPENEAVFARVRRIRGPAAGPTRWLARWTCSRPLPTSSEPKCRPGLARGPAASS